MFVKASASLTLSSKSLVRFRSLLGPEAVGGFFGSVWTRHQEAIVEIMKIVQRGTRGLRIIVGYAKKVKDSTILAVIPQINRSLEQFIYDVKEFFVEGRNQRAFSMGILKVKHLDGSIAEDSSSSSSSSEGETEMRQETEENL